MGTELEGIEIKGINDILVVVDNLLHMTDDKTVYAMLRILILGSVSVEVKDILVLEDRFKKGEELLKAFSDKLLKEYIEKRERVEERVATREAKEATKM